MYLLGIAHLNLPGAIADGGPLGTINGISLPGPGDVNRRLCLSNLAARFAPSAAYARRTPEPEPPR